ncbi:membrane protease YdiL (CAAX protease family) [Haloferula luteola]|uniref:Membrane protease YdiL (CAAX protease family) n=1 Tax=Haloferula luteola TaxID=595692 RepID=A0A840UZP4_9BACT|nr:type II CAAX endopeptidase family protein [Haloferula luteola]MBB5350463.1 membrane protease YdiL (CAAX protease family) [Haloferula luteola]
MNGAALRVYRRFSKRSVRGWIVVLVGLAWVMGEWHRDVGTDEESADVEATERLADASLVLEEGGPESSPWVDWLLGVDGSQPTVEWVEEELERWGLQDETEMDEMLEVLDDRGDGTGSALAEAVHAGEPLSEEAWEALAEDYEGLPWYRWEAESFRRLAQEGGPEWVKEGLAWRDEMRRWIVAGTLVAAGATLVFLVIGGFGVPAVLRGLRMRTHAPRVWMGVSTSLLLLSLLLSDLVMNWVFDEIYSLLAVLGEGWLVVDVVLDSAWRIGGAWLLLVLVLPRWKDAWHWFGMERSIQWKPLLGWSSLVLLLGSLWYPLASSWFPEPASVTFEEDGWGGLVFSVLSAVVLAPICEEIVYRGVAFGGLWAKFGVLPACFASTWLFTVVHHYGVAGFGGVFLMGAANCLLYRQTGSLKEPMILHAIHNGLITLAVWPVCNAPYSL